jgi:hypothetical protein
VAVNPDSYHRHFGSINILELELLESKCAQVLHIALVSENRPPEPLVVEGHLEKVISKLVVASQLRVEFVRVLILFKSGLSGHHRAGLEGAV